MIMKNIFQFLLITLLCLVTVDSIKAEKFVGAENKSTSSLKNTAAGCSAASGFRYLDINNVRGRINTGGDMWWDLDDIGRYYIPKEGSATSLFSGALWIGGTDVNGQLKLAAQRYRQVGIDYWPGPLTVDGTAAVDEETCVRYDQHTVITRAQVDLFLQWWNSENKALEFPDYVIPDAFFEYPAHGDISKNQSYYLAPFKDVNGDGDYDPSQGDYPYYDIANDLCPINFVNDPNYIPQPTMEEELTEYPIALVGSILVDQVLKGDQTFWWVFNDKGNVHTETQGQPIGMEIRAQAFAFATNDEINNMSFYSYEIINRSTFTLEETYMSPWCDTDLGYAWDDYVGCDVGRGLGYCYNGNAIDGSGEPEAYGDQPPAIGIDFFQGPYIDPDQRDNPRFTGDCSILNSPFVWDPMAINGVNFGNGISDDERFGMRRYVYHNNAGGIQGDPQVAAEYYQYLKGYWRDNNHMVYGGNAHPSNAGTLPDIPCDFMFPGDTDPCNWGTQGQPPGPYNQNGNYWTEETVDNNPDDRRFMQSAGPFTLKPGAVNYITVGVPWARAISGGPWESVELLRRVDDKCQKLFDNCFKVLDGPDAPDLVFAELNQSLIVTISNPSISNNYMEKYAEYDNTISQPNPANPSLRSDSLYRFEGYIIYQLRDASVTLESKDNPDMVRVVAQFDKKNGVGMLVNYYYDPAIEGNVPVIEVEGGDNGIVHSFEITEDAFAVAARQLINNKQYYYTVVAYSYNEYMPYSQEAGVLNGLYGQKKTFLAGRRNITTYSAIPHITVNGTVINAKYGDGPQITRIMGQGNGGRPIDLTAETVQRIMDKPPADSNTSVCDPEYPIAFEAVYEYGFGPVDVKVVDPENVKNGKYFLEFYDPEFPNQEDTVSLARAKWKLTDSLTGEVYYSDTTIDANWEQVIPGTGLSINVHQVYQPGDSLAINNGLIYSDITFADSSKRWLYGVPDIDIPTSPQNWIRAGNYTSQVDAGANDWNMPSHAWDEEAVYEKIIDGTWAPYYMAAHNNQSDLGPVFNALTKQQIDFNDLSSVDIVLTSDKSKWTRCVVLEMCSDPVLSEGGIDRFEIRAAPSVNKEGVYATVGDTTISNNEADPNFVSPTGMGWFPGYAINVETGERLNIIFGEDSWLSGENGRDMLFNPTSNIWDPVGFTPLFGGKHYVYVMDHAIRELNVGGYVYNFPAYDACRYFLEVPNLYPLLPAQIWKPVLFSTVLYTGIPLSVPGQEWLSTEAKIRVRITKPYKRFYSVPFDSVCASTLNINNYNPVYKFNTENIATQYEEPTKAENDLDKINVVPNPYYAYSGYERNYLDNRVKIVNLPQRCEITIFNTNGTLVRQYSKDEAATFLDWDLKNFAGIPIASGVYIIHIKSDVGEKILKWFGIIRPPDLNVF